jgi:SAM-dependent methyltransferase
MAPTATALASAIDDALIPPPEVLPDYARRGDFKQSAAAFVETAADRGLEPHHRVLDLGCGIGRFAIAFAAFADENASYEGLDVKKRAIAACEKYISSHLPRFRFHLVDVFNSYYRRDAGASAASYSFPFADESFDFVFSNSLFTHLTQADFEHYLVEIGRVLKPSGRALNTFFLINRASEQAMQVHRPDAFPFPAEGGVARVRNPERHEAAIAYLEDFVRETHAAAGLRIEEPVLYGPWSGREDPGDTFNNKDMVVAVRESVP